MPELPDITVYIESLRSRIVGQPLENIRIVSPSLLRTVEPPVAETQGKKITDVFRIGKQIVLKCEGDLFLVFHLMIAGRFHWKEAAAKVNRKTSLAALDFPNGTLILTEASTKKRASLHCVKGRTSLDRFNRGGLEVLEASLQQFRAAMRRENHTLKRVLTDPRLFSGIGNAYSDEILHRAGLSPLRQSKKLNDDEIARMHTAVVDVLREWTERLRAQTAGSFPEKVTAFHPEMVVHGKFRQPCPECGTLVQRIAYAENECNYCPRCQTQGKILADRSLSRLLRGEWPKTIEELEANPALGKIRRNKD